VCAGVDGAGAGLVGAAGFGAAGATVTGAGDEDAVDGAATAALGFGKDGFVAGLTACGGNAAPLAAGLVLNSSRFAAKTVNASTAIKKISASTWFLVLIPLSERCVVFEGDAIALPRAVTAS